MIRVISDPRRRTFYFFLLISRFYNAFLGIRNPRKVASSELNELNEVVERSLARTDISDQLVTLFVESLSIRPKLIVELGVRGGESTFVLERVARLCSSKLISVDIEDCHDASSYEDWVFVQKDDIEFANEFESWCKKHGIEPRIDILFIDTSHVFEQTLQEIKSWFPFMSSRSKVFLHDTNLKNVCLNKDGIMLVGWNNRRGVIRALERYFNKSFNEKEDFVDFRDGWLIKHYCHSFGFTILEKTIPFSKGFSAIS